MSDTLERAGAAGVGASPRRPDGIPKVRGTFDYGSDLRIDGMLFGATVRSPHAAARIRGIEVAAALATPGVHAVLTADDVPGERRYGLEIADQPVLAWDVVRFAGEPVVVVAADHPETARVARDRVRVDYEELPPLTDMERALDDDAPQLHPTGNVVRHVHIEHGDPDADAEVWVEGVYETGMQDQAALGPEAGLAIPAEDGGVDLHVTTQWLHADRDQIAPCLGLPPERVRLHLAGVGGAFGSREDLHLHVHACMLALHTGRPVRIVYGRHESFLGHVHRHPARIWMRTGATRDGRLVNVRARLLVDGGAYASSSTAVIANASTFAAGPYELPNARIDGTAVYTNNPPCGAMRGFGAPQLCFAHEAQMDRLAAALEMDPIELRRRNVLGPGSVLPTGQVIRGSAPVAELIERAAGVAIPDDEPFGGRDPIELPGGAGNVGRGEGVRRGTGLAVGYKNLAYSEGFDDASAALVVLRAEDGVAVAEVRSAAAEVGQGLTTVLAQIVTTELGVDDVRVLAADTSVGSSGSSSASRQTMMSGGAVQDASARVREELLERVRVRHELPPTAVLTLEAGRVLLDGLPLVEIAGVLDEPITAESVYRHRRVTGFDARGQGDIHVAFAFAAARAVVEVDVDLGLVRVVQVAVAQDVGRAINPLGVTGQIEGGTAQGLGLALMEELRTDRGRLVNASFTDYLLPTILDMPPVVSVVVEEPEPGVPYGAKGAGEPSTVVAPAAIAAAVRAASGREIGRLPIRPDDLVGLTERRPWSAPPPNPDVPFQVPVPPRREPD
ncbi:MAG TPA: xanthine dehydrogenase subunit D [Actinomycetota bacterium]